MAHPPRRIAHSEASMGWGGQEIRIFREMEAMRERGHQLCLFAPVRSRIWSEAGAAGFDRVPMEVGKLMYPVSMVRCAHEFAMRGIEVVNTHSSRDGWIAGIAARVAGVPLLIRSRHVDVDYPNRFLSRITFHHLPKHVLTTSEKIRSRLMGELGLKAERVSCLPTGIDPSRFAPEIKGTLHHELNLPEETPLVGVIAVLRSWKGHLDFLEAVSLLVKENTPAHFVLAGDGPMRQVVRDKIKELHLEDRVHLLGHRSDVPNVLASLQVVVLSSYAHEGIPQGLLQAQSMAKPVVGCAVGGIPEIVKEGVTGRLVPPRDPSALARAIGGLLENNEVAKQLGETGREQILKSHTLEGMCVAIEQIYDTYLGRS